MLVFLILLHVILFSKCCGESGNSSVYAHGYPACLKSLPHPGLFSPHPPYFSPKECPRPRKFEERDAVQCLMNRTVYVMGNSIARQYMFNILELIGGATVQREGQKKLCPKHETKWDASCMEEFRGVKMRFLFFRYMDGFNYKDRGGFPFIKGRLNNATETLPDDADQVMPKTSHEKIDNCVYYVNTHPGSSVEQCIQKFWNGATKDDILIFQLGFAFCEQENSEHIDYMAWLRHSAIAFKTNLLKNFPGTIFRINNAPVLDSWHDFEGVPNCLKEADKHLFELWHHSKLSRNDQLRWFNIDQYSMNEHHLNLYNDGVHFMGPLSAGTVQIALNAVCPAGGQPTLVALASHRAMNGTIYFVNSSTSSKEPLRAYFVDSYGYLRKLKNATGACVTNIKHRMEFTLSEDELDRMKYPIGNDFPAFCEANTLINVGGGRAIYVALKNGLSLFQSMAAMSSRGYDLDQGVTQIAPEDAQMFVMGPTLS
jgi:hypothetical protein